MPPTNRDRRPPSAPPWVWNCWPNRTFFSYDGLPIGGAAANGSGVAASFAAGLSASVLSGGMTADSLRRFLSDRPEGILRVPRREGGTDAGGAVRNGCQVHLRRSFRRLLRSDPVADCMVIQSLHNALE